MEKQPVSNLHFKIMSLWFKVRDLFSPPRKILDEAGISPGFRILDYGCGSGSFSIPAAGLVGPGGKVYAVDIHPLAVQRVHRAAAKKGLTNVEVIRSDCATGLESESLDAVLLYDILHDLHNLDSVLEELYRVLKPDGILSLHDPHMKEDEKLSKMTDKGLFRLSRKGEKTHTFVRRE